MQDSSEPENMPPAPVLHDKGEESAGTVKIGKDKLVKENKVQGGKRQAQTAAVILIH